MAHQSENAKRLKVHAHRISDLSELSAPDCASAEVWLIAPPFGRAIALAALKKFSRSLHPQSIVAILTSPQGAFNCWSHLSDVLHFQLWVAVKLAEPMPRGAGQLPQHHAALLLMSRYRAPLRHTKTRIGYTYCPACEKTTKDYGGKKHTYHEYGTLVSDVWRDINYTPGEFPTEICARLADLFGLEPYRDLHVVEFSGARSSRPVKEQKTPISRRSSVVKSRLINGDVLNVLAELPADSMDFCFADPPYNLAKRYDAWDDAIDLQHYLSWCERWIDELTRVLRPGCTCAILNIPILAVHHFLQMKRSLQFQSWIAWEGLSLPVRMIMPAHYAIVCFSKGPPRALRGLVNEQSLTTLCENYCLRPSCIASRQAASGDSDRQRISDLWWDIHRLKHNSRRVDHPCQLPPALMRRVIELFTAKGEIVLDPFNGAGTTTLCAQMLGRRYIGIELSPQYHAIALQRHEQLRAGRDPFAKVNGVVPKAKNSRVNRIGGGAKYEVPKKTLQLEVKRIAQQIGRLPSRQDIQRHSRYPAQYYDEYFISWGEVCAAARTTGMTETRKPIKRSWPWPRAGGRLESISQTRDSPAK